MPAVFLVTYTTMVCNKRSRCRALLQCCVIHTSRACRKYPARTAASCTPTCECVAYASILSAELSIGGRRFIVATSHLESPLGNDPHKQMQKPRWEQLRMVHPFHAMRRCPRRQAS